LPTDKPATFDTTVEMAMRVRHDDAFPGTVDFARW